MKLVLSTLIGILIVVSGALAGNNAELTVLQPSPYSEFRLALKKNIETLENTETSASHTRGVKSVKKSFLFSAIVPGSGQIYNNSYLKGILFLGVEIAAIALNRNYDSKANDFEDEFEALADANWNEDEYWNWIAEVGNLDRENMDALRDYEHRTFSHFLPKSKNQQYYENVGKYNQFVYGWKDFREFESASGQEYSFIDYQSGFFSGQDLGTISQTRSNYVNIRKDSNDNFKKATTMSTIIMFNHVISAVDAAFTTKFRNDKIKAELNIQGKLYYEELVPVLALGVQW